MLGSAAFKNKEQGGRHGNEVGLSDLDAIMVANEKFVLPVIQRRLVWEEENMAMRLDTISKADCFGGILATEYNIPGGKEKCPLNLATCPRLKFRILEGHSRSVRLVK